jgi:phosphatidate cytidylyltransferase
MPGSAPAFFESQPQPLLWGLGAVLAILVLGSAASVLLPRLKPGKDHTNLKQRVTSWWIMAGLLMAALLAGWAAMTLLFMAVSFIALREYLSLSPLRQEDRLIVLIAYLTIPVAYALVAFDQYGKYLVFVPVYLFLTIPFLMTLAGQTQAYLSRASIVHWGLVTCVYNLGYIPFLMKTPAWETPQAGPAGLVLLLLFATEANDVLQYCWGKALGRHKIMPKVSPNKTWEGFLGGWITTSALILLIGPQLTPLHGAGLWTVALLLPPAGFAGDVTWSAIKRDIGVKDTSALIPGHGGVLDRIDSLTFTAPLYFHLLAFFALDRF